MKAVRKTGEYLILSLCLVFMFSACSLASNYATQTVSFKVQVINEISVSGSPGPLLLNVSKAGAEPAAVEDSSTRYAITSNLNNMKITGKLDSEMPAYTALHITLTPPSGAYGCGEQNLSTTAQDLITGINQTKGSDLPISYKFSAQAQAGEIPLSSRQVVLTITNR